MSKLYQQLCDAIKNKNSVKIDEALDLLKNEQNPDVKKEFRKHLSTDFSDFLNQAKLNMVEENKIISKLVESGYWINITSYKRKRNEAVEEHLHERPAKKAKRPQEAYTQTHRNFVPPSQGTAQSQLQPLVINFSLPPVPNSEPQVAARTKKNTANDENFMENLKQVLRDHQRINNFLFKALKTLAEVEDSARESHTLISNSTLEQNEKKNFNGSFLRKAYKLALDNEARLKLDPEKYPFSVTLSALYQHVKHSQLVALYTKHSFDAFMALERVYGLLNKYMKDLDFFNIMENMESKSIVFIANESILNFLAQEYKKAPYYLNRILFKSHVEERLNALQLARIANPTSNTIYEAILDQKFEPSPKIVAPGENRESNNSSKNTHIHSQNYLDRYIPPPIPTVYSPINIQYNFFVNQPHYYATAHSIPPYGYQPQPNWSTNYSAPLYPQQAPQPQQSSNEHSKLPDKLQAPQQGMFRPAPTPPNQPQEESKNKVSDIHKLLN